VQDEASAGRLSPAALIALVMVSEPHYGPGEKLEAP
jgi:hypothetical protein